MQTLIIVLLVIAAVFFALDFWRYTFVAPRFTPAWSAGAWCLIVVSAILILFK